MNELNNIAIGLQNITKGIFKIAQFCNKIEQALKTPEFIQKLSIVLENVQNFPKYEKKAFELFPQFGWFPNELMFLDFWDALEDAVDGNTALLDSFMIESIDESWEELTGNLIQHYPQRKMIFGTAFTLHKEGNYIASIPLFLSQCDGIVFKKFNHWLFSVNKKTGNLRLYESLIKELEEESTINDEVLDIYYAALKINNDFSKFSDSANRDIAPNRHGVQHGLEEHLGYGTRANSYKAFSLLTYLDCLFNYEE